MRQSIYVLGKIFLFLCFAVLAIDFWRFFMSTGERTYLRIAFVLPDDVLGQIEAWAILEESTWANINRLVLSPFVNYTPLWVACLVLTILFRIIAGKGN